MLEDAAFQWRRFSGTRQNTDSIDGLYPDRPVTVTMLIRMGDPQVAFRLLTVVFAQRPSYLTRVRPPTGYIFARLEGYDARMTSTMGSLLGPGELESSSWRGGQAALSIHHGGVELLRSATSTPRIHRLIMVSAGAGLH